MAALLGAGLWWRRRRQMCSATAGRASSSENGKLADPEAPNTSNASMGLGAQMQSANPSESTHPSNSSKLMDQLADTGALQVCGEGGREHGREGESPNCVCLQAPGNDTHTAAPPAPRAIVTAVGLALTGGAMCCGPTVVLGNDAF